MAGEAELVVASLCGIGLAMAVATSYWFYTVPKRFREARARLKHLVEK